MLRLCESFYRGQIIKLGVTWKYVDVVRQVDTIKICSIEMEHVIRMM